MQVFIRLMTGKVVTVEVEGDDLVEHLKLRIQDCEGISTDQQRLIFEGKQLEDGRTLRECSIGKEADIELALASTKPSDDVERVRVGNERMVAVNWAGKDVDDHVVLELAAALEASGESSRVRQVDLSNNPRVTQEAAEALTRVVEQPDCAVVRVILAGTDVTADKHHDPDHAALRRELRTLREQLQAKGAAAAVDWAGRSPTEPMVEELGEILEEVGRNGPVQKVILSDNPGITDEIIEQHLLPKLKL
jgi:large subunit ribosomal protein L40e